MAEFRFTEQMAEQAITEAMTSCVMAAVSTFAIETVRNIFALRPTKVLLENGLPANITIEGKKGRPKAVFVTTKRLKANYAPAFVFAAAAGACYLLLRSREKAKSDIVM